MQDYVKVKWEIVLGLEPGVWMLYIGPGVPPSWDLAPPPLSRQQVVSLSQSFCVCNSESAVSQGNENTWSSVHILRTKLSKS